MCGGSESIVDIGLSRGSEKRADRIGGATRNQGNRNQGDGGESRRHVETIGEV
jgi:hypothetical protein